MPPRKPPTEKRVTRYSYEQVKEPRTPETGHTALMPADEQVVTLPMDNGWTKAVKVGKLPAGDERPVIVDMDPAADPVLFWAGKRSKREIPVLPLQRNEIVTESRIAQIIERAREAAARKSGADRQGHLFADLEKTLRDGDKDRRVEFYVHDENWKNKLICGDSLQVMESLVHYEHLRGKVQMIYMDPPYGIKYDSNFQQRIDTTKNDEKDAGDDVLTIKALRDTWALGVHSYLSYLQERLYMCRELLAGSGSVFVQMGRENAHLVKAVMDEVFGYSNRVADIQFIKAAGRGSEFLDSLFDVIIWYAKDRNCLSDSYRQLYEAKPNAEDDPLYKYVEKPDGTVVTLSAAQIRGEESVPSGQRFRLDPLVSEGESEEGSKPYKFEGKTATPPPGTHWKLKREGLDALAKKGRLFAFGKQLRYKRYPEDFAWRPLRDLWTDTQKGTFEGKRNRMMLWEVHDDTR
ncbi:MAG: DNA methyltransferase [Candidatus Methylomirabilia bacterium]